MTTYYKIRSKSDPELFRKADGRWNTSGKVYDTLGKVRSLITHNLNSNSSYLRQQTENWEIVEYAVTVNAVKQLHEIMDPKKVFKLLTKDFDK